MNTTFDRDLSSYVDERAGRLIEILRDLVHIPSENRAPEGNEGECQRYVAATLGRSGLRPALYTPDEAPDIHRHPLFWPGRQYVRRPNVNARRPGSGGGRSLILSGHIDTVPRGAEPWTRDPFGAEVEGNRIYGRGANDMKGGVATNLFVMEALANLNIRLAGDLTFETVVDEEFGGVNGTLAARLMGYRADAAVLSEPTALRVCPAQRGGRTVHITFTAPNDGVLAHTGRGGVIEQLRVFLNAVPDFARLRKESAPRHPLYEHLKNPVPVNVGRVHTAAWGTSEPPNTPPLCRVELFWQAMPGESLEKIDEEFGEWFDAVIASAPDVFASRPRVEHPIRWLPGSAVGEATSLITEFTDCVERTVGERPAVAGIEGPCDMYVFHEFGIPALLWGARGGNTHMQDEYVEIDSLIQAAKGLLTFVTKWCGVSR